ncbi:hypothetical protein [Pleionea sp. CnH1-48]|uniref:hypothetical protein n=1 Tax=Pleionea sp. CnH1-48 TaxID=2954494 RepID=UPI0020969DF1|nr:hypothetical protein [Pleionea sp. CnH1-48]MCO7225371.1 hypothetical protein [Pleionea sp. CnH1-48]
MSVKFHEFVNAIKTNLEYRNVTAWDLNIEAMVIQFLLIKHPYLLTTDDKEKITYLSDKDEYCPQVTQINCSYKASTLTLSILYTAPSTSEHNSVSSLRLINFILDKEHDAQHYSKFKILNDTFEQSIPQQLSAGYQ